MRSTFAWIAIALVFACRTKAGGVQIVATNAPSNVHFLRVYLGIDNVSQALDSSTSLTVPAPVAAALQGTTPQTTTTQNIFVRDPSNGGDTATYDGHDVTFEFESNGYTSTIAAAIVVGYTSDGSAGVPVTAALLLDLPVNLHEIDVYTADLGSAGAALPFLWSPVANAKTPVTNAACAGFSGAAGSAFVVAEGDDEDCDGYLDGSAIECSQFVFDDQAGVSTNETCLITTAAGPLHGEECRLGGRTCVDGAGVGSDSTCTATNTCLPNVACMCTSSDVDVTTNALGCVIEQQTATAGGYGCTVGAQAMNNCTIELPAVTTGGMPCKTTGNHGGLAVAGSTKFTTQEVDAGGYGFTLTIGSACGATLEIDPSSMGGSNGSGGAQSAFPNLLVKLVLVNGASLIYPVVLTANPAMTCTGDQPVACMRAPDDPFTPVVQQCLAGWGSATSTMLSGISPTLDADMDVMYFLDPITHAVMSATGSGSTWTAVLDTELTVMTPPAVAVHVTDDGMTLYITDAAGDVNVFEKSGNSFVASTTTTPFMPGSTPASWYSPNNSQQTDVIYADNKDLWELQSPTGPPFMAGTAFEPGQTPYMSEDSTALWFAFASNGSDSGSDADNAIYVQQRLDAGSSFSPPLASPELGMSVLPQGPWLQPLPMLTPGQQMMFFSREQMGENVPIIYSVQRAPLALP